MWLLLPLLVSAEAAHHLGRAELILRADTAHHPGVNINTVLMMDRERAYFPAASHSLQSDSSTRIISIKAIPTRKQTPEYTIYAY